MTTSTPIPPRPLQDFFKQTKAEVIMDWNGILFSPEDFGECEARDWMQCVDTGGVPNWMEFYSTNKNELHRVRTAFQAVGRKTDRRVKTTLKTQKQLRVEYMLYD